MMWANVNGLGCNNRKHLGHSQIVVASDYTNFFPLMDMQ